jgi:hypothetical protein
MGRSGARIAELMLRLYTVVAEVAGGQVRCQDQSSC